MVCWWEAVLASEVEVVETTSVSVIGGGIVGIFLVFSRMVLVGGFEVEGFAGFFAQVERVAFFGFWSVVSFVGGGCVSSCGFGVEGFAGLLAEVERFEFFGSRWVVGFVGGGFGSTCGFGGGVFFLWWVEELDFDAGLWAC